MLTMHCKKQEDLREDISAEEDNAADLVKVLEVIDQLCVIICYASQLMSML